MSVFISDGEGVNLETASEVEPVDQTDDSAATAAATTSRDTLVVQTGDEATGDVLAVDAGGVFLDETSSTGSAAQPGTETSLESTESTAPADGRTGSGGSPATSATNGTTATTSASSTRGASGSSGSTSTIVNLRTTTTTQQTTTRPMSSTQQSSTARQSTTTQQATTTQRITTTTASVNVNGPVVWVDSRAGSGGDGSQARPYRTVNEGILAVRAGETLMVKGGEYREHVNPGYRMPKGTSGSRITMTNAPGERVVIKGRVILNDMYYWTIMGINVTWDSERNDRSVQHLIIVENGTNWEWRDSEIWGAKAFSAFLIGGSPRNFAVRNNHIHDTYRTNDTNQDHLIYCSCGTGGGIIERNLLVGSSNGRAVKLGGSSSSGSAVGNVTVRYNTMVDNFGPSNIQLNFNTSNITMERNLMVGTQDYARNISTWNLTGSGSRATNNLGYNSPGVVESHSAISDGGGNVHRDPRLDSNYVPQDSSAKAYGHKAP